MHGQRHIVSLVHIQRTVEARARTGVDQVLDVTPGLERLVAMDEVMTFTFLPLSLRAWRPAPLLEHASVPRRYSPDPDP